mgnify:FL=1
MKNNIVSRTVVRQAIRAAIRDPDKNIPRILSMIEKADANNNNENAYKGLRAGFEDPNNNWNVMVHNLIRNVDPDVLESMMASTALLPARMSA